MADAAAAAPPAPPTLELNTRELNLNHLESRLPTVRCLVQWLQAQAAMWPLLERLALPAVKMGLRTVDQLQRLARGWCGWTSPWCSAIVTICCLLPAPPCADMFPCGGKMTDADLCDTLSGCPQLRVLELPECNYIGTVSIEHAVRCAPAGPHRVAGASGWTARRSLPGAAERRRRAAEAGGGGGGGAPLHRWASSIGTKKKRLRVAAPSSGSIGAGGAGEPPCAITWFDATQCRALCDVSLQQLFGTLRALCLNGCVALTDISIHNIVARCPAMQLLDISWSQITDDGLVHLLRGCRALQFLGCAHCDNLTDAGIQHARPVDGTWAELNQISFRSCRLLGTTASTDICTRWPMLRKVDLGGLPVPPAALLAQHGWVETRCQQFYRESAPSPAQVVSTAPGAATKRSYEDLLKDGWDADA